MEQKEIIEKLLAMHDESAKEDPMVYEVWEDGEVTLTKGGEIYGQRNLHTISPGQVDKALPVDSLHKRYNHSRIIVKTSEAAREAAILIIGDKHLVYI